MPTRRRVAGTCWGGIRTTRGWHGAGAQGARAAAAITLSRLVLAEARITPATVLLVSKPYMERRSYATASKLWPEVEVLCASEPLEFEDYVKSIGDEKLVLDMLVGDLQRVIEYPKLGFAIEQYVPEGVHAAYDFLLSAGFPSRLIST